MMTGFLESSASRRRPPNPSRALPVPVPLAPCLLLVALSFTTAGTVQEVDVLTASNFSRYTLAHQPTLVMFYAPWCPHSSRLEPIFVAAAAEVVRQSVAAAASVRQGENAPSPLYFAKVDGDAEAQLASRYGVASFPALKLFEGAAATDYDGQRHDPMAMASELLKQVRPQVTKVATHTALEAMLAVARDTVVVAAFAAAGEDSASSQPDAQIASTAAITIARAQHEWNTAVSDLGKTYTLVEATPPLSKFLLLSAANRGVFGPTDDARGPAAVFMVHLSRQFCGKDEPCSWDVASVSALRRRLQQGDSFPLIGLLTLDSQERYRRLRVPLVVLYMDAVDLSVNAKATRYILNRYRKLAAMGSGTGASGSEGDIVRDFRFAVADCRFWRYWLEKNYGEKECQQFFVTVTSSGSKYKSQAITQQKGSSTFAATALLPLLRGIISGETAPYRKTESLNPDTGLFDNVVPVTADTIGLFVGKVDQDAVVLLYEPWGAAARQKAYVVTEVAEYFYEIPSVVFVKLNVGLNDVDPRYDTSRGGLPKLFLVPAATDSRGSIPVEFTGVFDFVEVKRFVINGLTLPYNAALLGKGNSTLRKVRVQEMLKTMRDNKEEGDDGGLEFDALNYGGGEEGNTDGTTFDGTDGVVAGASEMHDEL